MRAAFEFFDHTADMGVRVHADSLPDLFRASAEALYRSIGDLVVHPRAETGTLDFTAGDRAELLQDFLSHLLVLFENQHQVMNDIAFETLSSTHLVGRGSLYPVDEEHSVFHREVKAITYHQLSVSKAKQGFEAVFILDI